MDFFDSLLSGRGLRWLILATAFVFFALARADASVAAGIADQPNSPVQILECSLKYQHHEQDAGGHFDIATKVQNVADQDVANGTIEFGMYRPSDSFIGSFSIRFDDLKKGSEVLLTKTLDSCCYGDGPGKVVCLVRNVTTVDAVTWRSKQSFYDHPGYHTAPAPEPT